MTNIARGTKIGGRSRSGTGRGRARYYYYVYCVSKNRKCRLRLKADTVEQPVLQRISELAQGNGMLDKLVAAVNKKLKRELPSLTRQRAVLQVEFQEVDGQADAILANWEALQSEASAGLLREKLDAIAERRSELEAGIAKLDQAIGEIEREAVKVTEVRAALHNVSEVFESLQPHQQRELLRLVLHRAVVTDTEVKLGFYGQPPDVKDYLERRVAQSLPKNSEPPKTLPLLDDFRNALLDLPPHWQLAIEGFATASSGISSA